MDPFWLLMIGEALVLVLVGRILRIKPTKVSKHGWIHGSLSD